MKNRFFVLGLAALMAQATVSAQSPIGLQSNSVRRFNPTQLANPADVSGTTLVAGKATEESQAIPYVGLYSNDFHAVWEQYTKATTFVYDPGSNTLMLIHPKRVIQSNTLAGGLIEAIISTDGGATFGKTNIFEKTGDYRAFPGIALTNAGVTTTADLNWALWGTSYLKAANWNLSGKPAIFKVTGGDPVEVPMAAPDIGNDKNYLFERADGGILVPTTGTNAGVFHGSRLQPSGTDPGQYGAYGQFYFNFKTTDYMSSMPEEWGLSNWKAGDGIGSTYNAGMSAGTDNEGAVYVAVNNVWISDETARVPGVSVSRDGAETWGPWNQMPKELLDTYSANEFGGPKYAVYDPFSDGDAFVVTGKDRYSYFFRLGRINDQNRFDRLDIVEAEYKNGAWSLLKVSELNDFPPLVFQVIDSASTSQGKWVPYVNSELGHEIQVARTADNSHLVIKWIDANVDLRVGVAEPITILYGAQPPYTYGTLDTLFSTDMFMSVRALDGSSWNTAVNMTNDAKIDKGTKMPAIIPSADRVPVIYHQGITNAQLPDGYQLKTMGWPDAFVERELGGNGNQQLNRQIPQTIRFATFNALNPNSVHESENFNFSLNNAKPNPATEAAEITFSLDVPGNISLVLFDMLGNRVNTLYSGQMDAGLHGLSVDPSALSNGTYYFTLTVNGKSITKTMVVMK